MTESRVTSSSFVHAGGHAAPRVGVWVTLGFKKEVNI